MLFDAKNVRNVNSGSIRGHDRRVVRSFHVFFLNRRLDLEGNREDRETDFTEKR